MYLADYHTHSTCSDDGRSTMTEMALAAAEAGLDELCLTDHVDVIDWQGNQTLSHDWGEAERQYAAAREAAGDRIKIKLGVELGQAAEDFSRADKFLDNAPGLDFIIGSVHNTAEKFGRKDFCLLEKVDESLCRECIGTYLDEVLETARWGRFSVLGHLTLPLRYMNENLGMNMSFEGFEDQCAEIFKVLIENGRGIELNTNRGNQPLPYDKLLKLYHDCGGRVITLGSDAHTPNFIGCAFAERAELLKDCGFKYYCTFDKMKPIFHKL